jgi:hypothetical protein
MIKRPRGFWMMLGLALIVALSAGCMPTAEEPKDEPSADDPLASSEWASGCWSVMGPRGR